MAKAIGSVLKVVGAAALAVGFTVLTGGTGALFAGTFFAISTSTLLITGVVATVAGSLLSPPSTPDIDGLSNHSRVTLSTRADPDAPRYLAFGTVGTGGVLRYQEDISIGAEEDPNHLWMVIVLAGHEIDSISDTIQFGGEAITFSGSTPASGKYQNQMFMWKHLGTESQTADANLVAATANWTSDHRLRGCAYVVIKIIADPTVYENGIQPFKFSLNGMKLYDPRLDSTNGGSGSQLLSDPTTWTFSKNTVLANVMYRYGIFQNGIRIAGMGIKSTRIDWPNAIAEANICDEAVPLAATGTEPRYECNGIIDPRNGHAVNLTNISISMAGVTLVQSGMWRCYAGAPRVAIKNRSRNDAIGGVAYESFKTKEAKYNSVKGQFISTVDDFNLVDVTPYTDATFLIEDNNETTWLDISFPTITSVTQAQRVMRIYLNRTRMEKTVSFPMGQRGLQDTVMDAINYTHEGYGINSLKMIIQDWQMKFVDQAGAKGFYFDVSYMEEDDSIYTWTTANELRFATATPQPLSTAARLPSDRLIGDTGTGGETVFNRVDVALEGDGSRLAANMSVNQGDDFSRSLPRGSAFGEAADGDAVTFANAWTDTETPEIVFGAGGISVSSTLTAPYGPEFIALSPSKTGFTMKARLKELLSGTTPVVDTGATTVSAGIIYDMDKSVAAEAVDDIYTFQFDVTIKNDTVDVIDGFIIVGVYTNDGGGLIQRGSQLYRGDLSADGATTTLTNLTIPVTVDGLGQIAGKEFRIVRESFLVSGTVIDAFDSVSYETGTAAADETATPSGAKLVQWQLNGGTENGVT